MAVLIYFYWKIIMIGFSLILIKHVIPCHLVVEGNRKFVKGTHHTRTGILCYHPNNYLLYLYSIFSEFYTIVSAVKYQ